MLRVTILGSGSRGNSLLIESHDTTVLVDAGFNPRTLARRLAMAGKRPEDVQALLLTHEHTDHACGAAAACLKWKWPLYATAGTLSHLPDAQAMLTGTMVVARCHSEVAIGGLRMVATPVPHDASEAAALVITDVASGFRVGVATDLGHVPEALPRMFERLDVLVVESNHDETMLANGPYPWILKRRVGSNVGHLSNRQSAALLSQLAHKGLRAVVLAHLSETNNTPEIAVREAMQSLRKAGWRREDVHAAHQTEIRGPFGPRQGESLAAPEQLSLFR